VRGPEGEGVQGVAVTNGEDIEHTDDNGGYRLGVDPGRHRFVHIAVPAGLKPKSGWYRRIEGARRASMGFDLKPAPETLSDEFTAAHITDTHVSVLGARSWTADVLARDLTATGMKGRVNVLFATGDLTAHGRLPELEAYAAVLRGAKVPVQSVFGGHDGNDERYSDECELSYTHNYERVLGPTYYSFDWGRWHFIACASEDYFFSEEEARMKAAWLRADLDLQPPETPVALLMHTPPSVQFLDELGDHNLKLVLCGHWHSAKVHEYRGITVAATQPLPYGGIDTTPRGYRLLSFKGGRFESELVALAEGSPREGVGGRADSTVLWARGLPTSSRASPVTYGDSLILTLSDDAMGRNGGVARLDTSTGELIWRTRTDTSVRNGVAPGLRGGEAICAALSVTGRLYLLAVDSGGILWERDLPGHPDRWVFARPVVDETRVYAGAKGGYGAFSMEDGSPLWYSITGPNDAWPCYASPCLYDDLLIVLVSRKGIVALDSRDGGVAWEAELPAEYHYASPAIAGNRIVTGGERGRVAILEAGTGEVISGDLEIRGSYPTGLVVDRGEVFASTSDGFVEAHGLATGELIWTFHSGQDILDMTPYARNGRSVLAAPLVIGDTVAVCGCDGFVHILERGTGIERSCTYLGAPVASSPCMTPHGICVVTHGGGVHLLPGGLLDHRVVDRAARD
jgi:outer membrane protein assembly factor BamB/predicted MPP superfamily phosphohydrolase